METALNAVRSSHKAPSRRQEDQHGPIAQLDRRCPDAKYFIACNDGTSNRIVAFVKVGGKSYQGQGRNESAAKQAAAEEALRHVQG